MLFNSIVYITLFGPAVIIGWHLLQRLKNPVWAKLFLLGASLVFYGYYNLSYVGILIASLLFNYVCSALFQKIGHEGAGQKIRKPILWIGILGNLGLLFYFKYFNFFIDNCNFFLHTDFTVEKIALPLGISFFTFQQVSYVVDRYRGDAAHRGFLDYGCFIAFFPQLIAGPIVLHDEFLPQLDDWRERKKTADGFYAGASLFILGLAKKVLLADLLAVPVNAYFPKISSLDAPAAWIIVFFYTMELYFDFSGYCDMARGIAQMMGFTLPVNFRSPLTAVSVRDFWRRWHITLSRFLTQYIYIPLGGNRKGLFRQCFNIFVVFLASGFWHGANWTFVVWGLLHGAVMVAETLASRWKAAATARCSLANTASTTNSPDEAAKSFLPKNPCRLLTFLFVALAFAVFRSDSLSDAALLWNKMFAGGWNGEVLEVAKTLRFPENEVLAEWIGRTYPQYADAFSIATLIFLFGLCIAIVRGRTAQEWIEQKGQTTMGAFLLATLFVCCFISLSQVSVFLYFNF